MFKRALDLTRGAIEPQGPKDNPKKQYMQFKDNSDEWNLALDKEMTAAMLKNYAEHVPAKYLPDVYSTIKKSSVMIIRSIRNGYMLRVS